MRGTEYPRLYAALLFSCSPVKNIMCGTEYPRPYAALLFSCSPVLLFSCQKDLRGTECLRYYARAIIFVFFVTKIGVASLIIKRQ